MRLPRRVRIDEVLDLGLKATVACHRFQRPVFRHWWHAHPELELVVVLSGQGTRHVGDSVESYAAGDVVLVGSRTPHSWGIEPGAAGHADCAYAQWSGESLLAAARPLAELRGLERLFSRARRGLVVDGALACLVRAEMLELHARRDQPLPRLAALLRILALLGDGQQLRPLCSPAYVVPEGPEDTRQARLQRFLHEHRGTPVPVARAAAVAGVAASSFSRFFTSAFNRTYRSYCIDLRLAEACRLLSEGEQPVLEIALAAGFANLANFNRRFREAKGMTPSAWRRATRSG
jgi:AraC-like DNA-binding protein